MLFFLVLSSIFALTFLSLWLLEKGSKGRLEVELRLSVERLHELSQMQEELKLKEEECTQLKTKMGILEEAETRFKSAFQTLSLEALEKNNRSFLELAKNSLERFQEGAKGDLNKRQSAIQDLITPLKESLGKLDVGLGRIEKERRGDQEALKTQMRALQDSERLLKQETSNLVKALRTPLARGRWGEIQLRRVVELSGMLNQCDFFEQSSGGSGDERFRPDLIVRLPGGRQVVIDAKVPLEAYLEAIHSDQEETRRSYLASHARQVRAHVMSLGKKAYWEHFQPSPEFVVLFLPAETFFSAALEMDPSLIEAGAEQNVIIATPTTLIALLRAVAYGWKQENLSSQVEKLHELGLDLYKRLGDVSSHFAKVGRGLTSAVDAYNKGIGSFESRVLVAARKFKEMGVSPAQVELEVLESVDKTPRELSPSVIDTSEEQL